MLCAAGLPQSDALDVEVHVSRLDAWAERIRRMTDRHYAAFLSNRDRFDDSEPKWRLLAMAKLLHDECRVRYQEDRLHSEPDWSNSQELLLHGITSDRRQGTCATLPVLVVAIGRRLGYPLCLSQTVAHCFSRWDGTWLDNPAWNERFNIEFHGHINFHDDEHYYEFPVCWPQQAREAHRRGDRDFAYLRSTTPAEEFAYSLCQRAICLEANGLHIEAINTYYRCRDYDRRWGGYLDFAKRTLRSRAENVMRSMGFQPAVFLGWIRSTVTFEATQLILSQGAVQPGSSRAQSALFPSSSAPSNICEFVHLVLAQTCAGTPATPSLDLLFPHPPEPKVDPYASLRNADGKLPKI